MNFFKTCGMIYELFRINSEKYADIAQSVERILGKDEVTGSNPVISSMKKDIPSGCPFSYAVGTDLVIFGVHNSPIRCKGFGLFMSP